MSYIDPKEEVISLELTPYGRYALSRGRLAPVYYAFFDDDVVYDTRWITGSLLTEDQSEAEGRILNETIRMKAQAAITGRETDILSQTKLYTPDGVLLADDIYEFLSMGPAISQEEYQFDEAATQRLYSALTPQPLPSTDTVHWKSLGNYNSEKQHSPSWNMTFLRGEISSSLSYMETSGSRGVSYNSIPQINTEVEYKVERNNRAYNIIRRPDIFGEQEGEDNEDIISETIFSDNSSISVMQDYLVIRLEESNTFFEKENFDIELFEVTEDEETGEEQLSPLKFFVNDAFSNESIELSEGTDIDPLVSEYYFSCLVDEEIGVDTICPLIKRDDTKQFYISKIFDCEEYDLGNNNITDIYADEDDTRDVCE